VAGVGVISRRRGRANRSAGPVLGVARGHIERFLRRQRVRAAVPFIPAGARVLDGACGNGALFRRLGPRLGEGLGLDARLAGTVVGLRYRLVAGQLPADVPPGPPFDVVTLLHVGESLLDERTVPLLARTAARLLHPGGRLILGVVAPLFERVAGGAAPLPSRQADSSPRPSALPAGDLPELFARAGLWLEAAKPARVCGFTLYVFTRARRGRRPERDAFRPDVSVPQA
jgi:SAM-dependent methyltransferase